MSYILKPLTISLLLLFLSGCNMPFIKKDTRAIDEWWGTKEQIIEVLNTKTADIWVLMTKDAYLRRR